MGGQHEQELKDIKAGASMKVLEGNPAGPGEFDAQDNNENR